MGKNILKCPAMYIYFLHDTNDTNNPWYIKRILPKNGDYTAFRYFYLHLQCNNSISSFPMCKSNRYSTRQCIELSKLHQESFRCAKVVFKKWG